MEHKYLINLVYQQPYIKTETGFDMGTSVKTTSLGYTKYKDAKKAYDEFNRRHVLEYNTEAGHISFFIISVEFVDRAKLTKVLEERKLKEEEENGKTGEEAGVIEHADNEEFSNADESTTEQEILQQEDQSEQ